MSRRVNVAVILVLTLMAGLAGAAVAQRPADNSLPGELAGPKTAPLAGSCSIHARLMRLACFADVKDGLYVHRADCLYTTPVEDQLECFFEAQAEAVEGRGECRDIYDERRQVCELIGEARFDVEFDPDDFVDPDDIGDTVPPNTYWPLTEGHTQVIVGDGEVTVVTATDEVREVGGLPCRVIRDLVFEEVEDGEGSIEYEAAEVTQDWYAQHVNGDVIYCGENTYEIEDELIDNTDGSFANGSDRARAGFLLREMPVIGEGDRQEMASDEAEDYVEYVSLAATPSEGEGGDSENFPCDGECLQTFEVNPRDPGESEFKYYLPDTGFVLATKFEDGEPTGEREEVSCIGDSLEVLDEPECEIGDPDALREALCFWAPAALCEDD